MTDMILYEKIGELQNKLNELSDKLDQVIRIIQNRGTGEDWKASKP